MMIVQAGQRLMEECRRLEPVEPGHLDVEQGDVGLRGQRRGHHLVAARALGDDVDVLLEREQGGERAADHPLVLGDQDVDHVAARGTYACRRNPPRSPGPASRCPPAAPTRSRSPCSPLPPALATPPTPSSTIATVNPLLLASSETSQWCARLWRRTLVIPSRTVHASRLSTGAGAATLSRVTRERDSRCVEHVARALQLVGERTLAVPGDHGAHLGERVAGDDFDVADRLGGGIGIAVHQPARDLCLSAITDRLWPRMS